MTGTGGRSDASETADADTEYLLVTEYFHPDTASTGQLLTELAVGLRERGLDLRVATGQPNYRGGDNERQPRRDTHEGVPVRRIRAPQVRQSSLPRRLFNWTVFTVWMSLALLVDRPGSDREVLFVSNPPFLPVALGAVCRLRGWPYTYVVYDLYPDQPVELGYLRAGGLVDRLWSRANGRALRGAADVVALGPVMAERVADRAGIDPEDVAVIHNWADGEFVRPMAKADNWFSETHGLVDPFAVLYSGNVGEFHDLETLVRAAAAFADEPVRFLVVGEGDGKASVVERAAALGVRGDTVRFLPYQPREDLPYSLTSGDVSVVTVEEGFEGVCVSSKLYTALAAGTPVLCICQPDDDEARVVSSADAGFVVPQGDVAGVVEAVERWRADPDLVDAQGTNARRAFEERFTRERAVGEYYRLLVGGE